MQGGADLLMAVQANNSRGTQGAIDYAVRAGKTVIKYDALKREYSKLGGQQGRNIGVMKERTVSEFDGKVKSRGFEL